MKHLLSINDLSKESALDLLNLAVEALTAIEIVVSITIAFVVPYALTKVGVLESKL